MSPTLEHALVYFIFFFQTVFKTMLNYMTHKIQLSSASPNCLYIFNKCIGTKLKILILNKDHHTNIAILSLYIAAIAVPKLTIQ